MCAVLWAQWQLQLWGLKQTAGSRHRRGEVLSSRVRQVSLSVMICGTPASWLWAKNRANYSNSSCEERVWRCSRQWSEQAGNGASADNQLFEGLFFTRDYSLSVIQKLPKCFNDVSFLVFNELMNSLTHSLLTLQWASNYNTQKMFFSFQESGFHETLTWVTKWLVLISLVNSTFEHPLCTVSWVLHRKRRKQDARKQNPTIALFGRKASKPLVSFTLSLTKPHWCQALCTAC